MADAQASGACGSNIVWVQVPSSALFFIYGKSFNKTSHFSFIYQNMFEKSFLQSAYYLHQSMPEKRLSARYASHLQQVCLNEGNITGSLMIQKTSDNGKSSMWFHYRNEFRLLSYIPAFSDKNKDLHISHRQLLFSFWH